MGGYVVYVLRSKRSRRTYVGQTEYLAARISAHNAGKVCTAKAFCPLELIHVEECETRAEAMRREKWYSVGSCNGWPLLQRIPPRLSTEATLSTKTLFPTRQHLLE